MLANRRFQIAIFTSLGLVTCLYGVWQYRYSHDTERLGYENIPEEGLIDNDTKGLVPGNPENGVRALKNYYKFALVYKRIHGTLPPEAPDLYTDVVRNPEAYGVKGIGDLNALIGNPDNRYSDNKYDRASTNAVSIGGEGTRPDGTKSFTTKRIGTRDVIGYSSTYIHENIRTFPGERSTSNPVGFYQVLWEDGSVQQIPFDQVRYVLREQRGTFRSYKKGFPGQAGVPDKSLSYDDFFRQAGYAKGPRGGAGKPGLDYKGKPIGKS